MRRSSFLLFVVTMEEEERERERERKREKLTEQIGGGKGWL